MSTYAITPSIQRTVNVVDGRTQGFRLKMVLTAPVGFVDAGLFLFLRQGTTDIFQAICSPANLNDYTLAAPSTPEPFLRLDNIDLVFSSQVEALSIEQQILVELKTLCDEMAKLAIDLSIPVTVTISDDQPYPPVS